MKLMRPLVSRTAHSTRSSDPIPSCLAAARSSPSVILFRARFLSIGSPSWTTMTGSPSITGRRSGNLEAPVGDDHGENGDRAARKHEAGDREVVLGHALLDEIPDHHEQDQVERLQRSELPPADDPRHEEDEEEREGCAEDDVHSGR